MKTSFYFVLWISIYPIISLIPSAGLQQYSFLAALAIVFILSMGLNKMMFNIIRYESICNGTSVMENIYNDNVAAFRKRINRETTVETISAIYFIATTILLLYLTFTTGRGEIVALVVFAFLSIGAYTRAAKLLKASSALRRDSSAEECMTVAYSLYRLDYEQYYNQRNGVDLKSLLPTRPRRYKLFLIISIVIADICALLGIVFVLLAVVDVVRLGMDALSTAFINILYGTLAIYFGIRDFISSINSLRAPELV